MHLLFLCSQNKRRSLTAEKLFNGYESHDARSAGTENNARVKVTPRTSWVGGHYILYGKETRQKNQGAILRHYS